MNMDICIRFHERKDFFDSTNKRRKERRSGSDKELESALS